MRTGHRTTTRIEPLQRSHAAEVAEAEVRAFRDPIATLEEADWGRATVSAGWRVREVVAHVGGHYEELARIGTFRRRLRSARRRYNDRTVPTDESQSRVLTPACEYALSVLVEQEQGEDGVSQASAPSKVHPVPRVSWRRPAGDVIIENTGAARQGVVPTCSAPSAASCGASRLAPRCGFYAHGRSATLPREGK